MRKKITIAFTIFVASLLIAGCTPNQNTPPGPGKYAAIGQCLTEKGVKFYGAFWCPHCLDQKKAFGSDIQYVTYVECDPAGKDAKPEECRSAGVERYPSWFFPGQGITTGVQTPEDLAKKANCEAAIGAMPTISQEITQETTQETSPQAS